MRGHNNLMYRYQGMDGIKTGYTNASGFNLVSAVRDGNRRVVGVVLGGRTARSRDDKMAGLLDRYLGRASSSGGAKLVASVGAKEAVEVASAADASDVPVPLNAPRPADDLAAKSLAYADDAVVPLDRPVAMDEILNAGKTPKTSAERTNGDWQIQISAAPSADAARASGPGEVGSRGATRFRFALYRGGRAGGQQDLSRSLRRIRQQGCRRLGLRCVEAALL